MNKSTKVLWGLIIVLLIIAVVVIANVISLLPKENTSSINEELLIPDTETNLQGNNSVVENEEGKTFRNTYWGMTIDQVKNKETAQFLY